LASGPQATAGTATADCCGGSRDTKAGAATQRATANRNRSAQLEASLTKGEEYIQWVQRYMRVPEGDYVGQPLVLRPFQRHIIRSTYDATPRPRYVIITMGKKNAKTTLSAVLLLLNICGPESKPNSQLYSTGQSRKQASTIYKLACKMLNFAPDLDAVCVQKDSTKEIVCPERGTEFMALSSEAKSQHGASPRFLIHDELGMVRGDNWDLFDAMETADQAHSDAMTIIISTQAPGNGDLLSILIDDAVNTSTDPDAHPIVSGDKKTLVFSWSADDKGHEDDKHWAFSEEAMRQANPAFGDFLSAESMKKKANDAKRMPSKENVFRNFNLNQRVEAVDPFVPRGKWLACGDEPDPEAFGTGRLYCGLDLSKRTDLTAFVAIAQGRDGFWNVLAEFWAPRLGVVERAQKDRAPYDQWMESGYIRGTPGATVDYELVAQYIIDLVRNHDVGAIAFDPWRFDVLVRELARLLKIEIRADDMRDRVLEVIPLVPVAQSYRGMAAGMETFEARLLGGKFRHGGHPVLTMCSANARADTDSSGNQKLDKARSTGRIDGLQALVMANGVSVGKEVVTEQAESVYESRGMVEV
jgi:phage terminase large subunit-like protein